MVQNAWRVVDCTQLEGKLRYTRGRLLVCPAEGNKAEIPLAQLAVVLLGQRASALLHYCFNLLNTVLALCFAIGEVCLLGPSIVGAIPLLWLHDDIMHRWR